MYKALVNFSGKVSMSVGEIADIADVDIVKDLISAGYIEEVKPADKGDNKPIEKPKRTRTKKD